MAGKEKVLVKGSNYLDILINADTMVLDKTGTITKGTFEVSDIITNEITKEELINIAGIAESMSNHPIAKSIVKKANIEIDSDSLENFEEIPGMGVIAKYKEDEIVVGNSKIFKNKKIEFNEIDDENAVVYIAKNNKYIGAIIISDVIKEDSIVAIKEFKDNGIKNIYMLTGDNKEIANKVANEVGIKNVFSNLLPVDKVETMQNLKEKCDKLIAIGDGINDSPLLALSDIGVSIGNTGSDLAIETSDIVIMDGKLSSFNKLIKTAKRTKRIVKQNIYFAIAIKIIVLALGAIGISTMWEAVFADVGVTFITVINSLRILKKR